MEPDESSTQNEAMLIELHRRKALGEPLTDAERAALDAWYARNDAEESAIILANQAAMPTTMQSQIDAALEQLVVVTQRVKVLSAENQELRGEIERLSQRLSQTTSKRAA